MATLTTTEVLSVANALLAEHSALMQKVQDSQRNRIQDLESLSPPFDLKDLPLVDTEPPSPTDSDTPPPSPSLKAKQHHAQLERTDLAPEKRARVARYRNYVPEEETIRNDYSQRYVDGGEWPQNWVLGAEPERRFEEYPKQHRFLNLKKTSVKNCSLPPTYLPYSLFPTVQQSKFDAVLIDPPFSSSFTWDHLQELPVPTLAADPSFVFLWVGSGAGEGLERGREVLGKWGYRRCEDVCWVKTNRTTNRGPGMDPPTTSVLTRTKEHCLIGIRGTVRRSTDSWFVHCNVDTDVIIWEGDQSDPMRKPPEMYTLIENFCLGTRRLEIFGRAPTSFRRGWVTVLGPGQEDRLPGGAGEMFIEGEEGGEVTPWNKERWEKGIEELVDTQTGKFVVPMTSDIDALRPKSPVRNAPTGVNTGGGPGGGGGGRFQGGGGAGGPGGGGNRGFGGNNPGGPAQNQMMAQPQPMMGMPMNNMGMGGPVGVPVDGMMWAPGMMAMNNMGPAGMGGMGNMSAGGMGMPMMGPGMGGGMQMMPMGGGPMQGMQWGDQQGQFGMEGVWEGDGMMNMPMSMNGMGGTMNMGGGMGGGINMGPWSGGGGGGF